MSKQDFPIVLVKNLPYGTSDKDLFDLFGAYGAVHQIRAAIPNSNAPQGTCFVVYQKLLDAQLAAKRINGINYQGRYLTASMYQVDKTVLEEENFAVRAKNLQNLKDEYGIE